MDIAPSVIERVKQDLREVDGEKRETVRGFVNLRIDLGTRDAKKRIISELKQKGSRNIKSPWGGAYLIADVPTPFFFSLKRDQNILSISEAPRHKVPAVLFARRPLTAAGIAVAVLVVILATRGTFFPQKEVPRVVEEKVDQQKPEDVTGREKGVKRELPPEPQEVTKQEAEARKPSVQPPPPRKRAVSKVDVKKLSEEGEKSLDKGEYEKAVAYFNEVINHNPNNDRVLFELGLAYYHLGKMTEAIQQWEKAVGINPSQKGYRKNLGHAYLEMGDKRKARVQFEEILKLDPGDEEAKMALEMTE